MHETNSSQFRWKSVFGRPHLLLGITTLASSLTPIFARITVSEVSPVSLGFLRFALATVLFCIISIIGKSNFVFEKRDYFKLILLGGLCIPVNQYFFLTGIKMSYAAHSGIIYSLNPVFAYVTLVLKRDEKFVISKMLAILLTIIGVSLVFYEAFSHNAKDNVIQGDLLLVLAVLSFSLYISLGKNLIKKYGPLKVTTFAFVSGTILYIPFFVYDAHNLNLSQISPTGIFGFFYLALVVSFAAYFTWYYILKTINVSMVTTFSNLAPVFTVLFSIILLNESISLYFILGGITAVIGVMIMHRASLEIR